MRHDLRSPVGCPKLDTRTALGSFTQASGRPRTDPRLLMEPVRTWRGQRMVVHTASTNAASISTTPAVDPSPPCTVESAREYLVTGALTHSTLGTVGLELERHVVDLAAPGSIVSWRRLERALEGADLPHRSKLTMEPGGQIELSTLPAAGIDESITVLQEDCAALQPALAAAGLGLHSTGADPVRSPVRVHPGDRYAAMAAYFTSAGYGDDAATMMCSSASLQLNVEAGPEAGWSERIAQVHRLTPVLLALSACSPMLRGRERGHRSERAAMWQRLDPGRCSPFAGHGDPAGAWASFALAAPVMQLWITGERKLGERAPTLADLDLHTTTLFPPLRLRGFLELRLLDTVPAAWWPGLAALTVAVLDDPAAASRAAEAAEPVARRTADAARLAITDPALAAAARALVEAALPAVSDALRPDVERWAELLESGRTPADLVLERARRDGPLSCLTAAELC
jgi:ergothioneine biosynthesis glutamate--cysteine ligase EgtA